MTSGGGLNVRHVSYPTSSSDELSCGGVRRTGALETCSTSPCALRLVLEWESGPAEWEWGSGVGDEELAPLVGGLARCRCLGLGGGGRWKASGVTPGF